MLGQDPTVSAMTGTYVRTMMPGVLMMVLFDAKKNSLNAMNQTTVPTMI